MERLKEEEDGRKRRGERDLGNVVGIWNLGVGRNGVGGFQTGLSDVNSCHPLSSVYLERQ